MTVSERHFIDAAPQQTLSAQIGSTDVSLTVPSFSGWPTLFPFGATLDIGTNTEERILVTAISGTTATITRGQFGSAAIGHPAGATLDMTVMADDHEQANAHQRATSGVHGVGGNVVGDSDVQNLYNKTLVAATLSGTTTTQGLNVTGNISASGSVSAGTGSITSLSTTTLTATTATLSGDETVAGNLNVGGTATVGSVATSGAVTANSVNASGAVTGLSVGGILAPTQFANETAAGTATAGTMVWLTAPTNINGPGLYVGDGTNWNPFSHDTGWQNATLQNSWVSYDGGTTFANPRYRRKNGTVFIEGLVKSGTSPATIFTLPAGYRPGHQLIFNQINTTASAPVRVDITTAGLVSIVTTSTGVSLNGITFIAEQ